MKNILFIKSTGLVFFALIIGSLLFTSANTKDAANQQNIADLSAKLAEMKTEIQSLKEEEVFYDEPFRGEIRMFGGNFAPRGWAFCDGQLLPINGNDALYSILGTTYGGDGRTSFGLPDLRGRVAVHSGDGPGLRRISLGEKGGAESTILRIGNMPYHDHEMSTFTAKLNPDGAGEDKNVFIQGNGNGSGQTGNTGGSQEFSTRNPYQGVNYIIALEGVYPSRS